MPARIVQDVGEGVAYLARCFQRSVVEAIAEHPASPVPQSIEPSCDANQESLHAARETRSMLSFDDEVQVVRLDREVNQPKAVPVATLRKRIEQHTCLAPASQ